MRSAPTGRWSPCFSITPSGSTQTRALRRTAAGKSLAVMSSHSMASLLGVAGSAEVGGMAGGRGEAEVAARQHRLAAAVALEQLGLAALGPRIDLGRIADRGEPGAAVAQHLAVARVGGDVDQLLGIGGEVEEL